MYSILHGKESGRSESTEQRYASAGGLAQGVATSSQEDGGRHGGPTGSRNGCGSVNVGYVLSLSGPEEVQELRRRRPERTAARLIAVEPKRERLWKNRYSQPLRLRRLMCVKLAAFRQAAQSKWFIVDPEVRKG